MNCSRKTRSNISHSALIFPILLFFSLSPLSLTSCSGSDLEESTVKINDIIIPVEVAQTPDERHHGLMERKKLDKEKGMLFVFDEEEKLSFWMKNTSIPLSIAYIAKNGEIKEIYDLEPFSQASVKSKWSVQYALEVNRGFFAEKGIKPGDTVEIAPRYK